MSWKTESIAAYFCEEICIFFFLNKTTDISQKQTEGFFNQSVLKVIQPRIQYSRQQSPLSCDMRCKDVVMT